MGFEELWNAFCEGVVKGTTFVLVRKAIKDNEKTTPNPTKRKGGFFKK